MRHLSYKLLADSQLEAMNLAEEYTDLVAVRAYRDPDQLQYSDRWVVILKGSDEEISLWKEDQ